MIQPWFWHRRSARLARDLPPPSVGMALGDLLEEFAGQHARTGRLRAEWWLHRELASLGHAYRATDMAASRRRAAAWLPNRSDLTHAARSLGRSPWYALTAAGVLALGLSLSITVFAIVDGALFKPLPYQNSDRLFALSLGYSKLHEPPVTFPSVSPADVDRWRHALPDLQISAFSHDLQTIGTHETIHSARVDAAFFDVLGLQPAIGGFSADDFNASTPIRPALLSDSLWRDRFGGDRSIIGRTFFDAGETGQGIRVVGVLPPDFVFPFVNPQSYNPRLLTPLPDVSPKSIGRSNYVLIRLTNVGETAADAASKLDVVIAADAASRPTLPTPAGTSDRQRIVRAGYDTGGLVPIRTALTGRLQESSWVVFGAAGCLVLLACLNVTGLMITRLRDRWRELAVRRALGASARDLVRLLAAESTLIVGAGATLGVSGAWLLLPLTTRFLTGFLLVLKPAVIDVRVAVYAAITSVICVLLTTLLATRAATRAGMRLAVADGGGTSRRERRGRLVLALEIALAFVVAVSGALVSGSLIRVWAEDPGFDMRHTGVISLSAPRGASATDIDRLIEDIQHMPGVAHAGGVAHALLEHAFNGSAFDPPAGIPDVEESGGPGTLPIESIPVTRGYFAAAGLRAIDGRVPADDELSRGAAVIAVADRVARAYWPGRRAVGETLLNHGRPFTVVGVVPNARFMSLDAEPQGEIYWPVGAMPKPYLASVLVRLDPDASLGPVAAALVRGCPACWVRQVQMLEDALGGTIRQRQFSAWLFSAFGIAALLTVGTGILGLVAMTTKRRTREIGIRIALGASRGSVLAQIVREQVQAVAFGLALGAIAAAWLTGFLTGYLYKTAVYDAWSWAAAIAAILIVALIGTVIPSRHASRIDPVRALRAE